MCISAGAGLFNFEKTAEETDYFPYELNKSVAAVANVGAVIFAALSTTAVFKAVSGCGNLNMIRDAAGFTFCLL